MIDNDSKQQVKIIELSTKQEARNTELGLQQIAKSEKKVNQLEKELASVKRQSEEIQRVVTSLKNTGKKDTPEYYKKVEQSEALKEHRRSLVKSLRGQKGYQAMQKKIYGIDKKANIRYNDKDEAYLLNEQESGLYTSIKKSAENNKVRKRVQDEFFKTEQTKNKLTGENNDKVKKVNKSLVDTNRILNAFKASLIGFGLYKAITNTIRGGVETTNRITKNALDMNMSVEDSRAIEYAEDRLGGKAYRGTLQSVFKKGVERKSRYGVAGGKLTEEEGIAFNLLGLNPSLIKELTSTKMTGIIIDSLLNKYRQDKKYDEMENLARKLGGDELVSVLKTLLINPALQNKNFTELFNEGKNITEMPRDYLYNMEKYNKEMGEFFARLDAGISRLANLWQLIAGSALGGVNSFLNIFSPNKETANKNFDDAVKIFNGLDNYLKKAVYSSFSFTESARIKDSIDYVRNNDEFIKLNDDKKELAIKQILEFQKHKGVYFGNSSKSMLVNNINAIVEALDDGKSGTKKLDTELYKGYSFREILGKVKKMQEDDIREVLLPLYEIALRNDVGEGLQTGNSMFGVGGKGLEINVNITKDQEKIFNKALEINNNSQPKTIITENIKDNK